MARLLMEDTEWAFFKPFITGILGRGGRPASNHRQVLDGIFRIARTGAQWRDLPSEFGKWSCVYRQFRRWTLAGLWDLIIDTLNESEAMPDQVQMIHWLDGVCEQTPRSDSTVIHAHHQTAGAKAFSVIASNHPPVNRRLRDRILAVQKVALRRKST